MLFDMETQTISVPDISCDHCKMSIEEATGALAGVTETSVDIPGKTVTVTYEGTRVEFDTIVSAIEDQGYEVAR